MPIYEYICPNCGKIEIIQKINEKLNVCPKCSCIDITKMISSPGLFDLKGSGFYINDYKKKKR